MDYLDYTKEYNITLIYVDSMPGVSSDNKNEKFKI